MRVRIVLLCIIAIMGCQRTNHQNKLMPASIKTKPASYDHAKEQKVVEDKPKSWFESLPEEAMKVESSPPSIEPTHQPMKRATPEPSIQIPVSNITQPAELQKKRRDMIISLIDKGVFNRVEYRADIPKVWIGPVFMSLDFQTKTAFAEVVWAYYFDEPDRKYSYGETIYLKDSYNGKTVGSYSPFNVLSPGLSMK